MTWPWKFYDVIQAILEIVVTWPKFDYSSISVRKVIIPSNLWGFGKKKQFFKEVGLGSSSIT